jgi:hypothetical protein
MPTTKPQKPLKNEQLFTLQHCEHAARSLIWSIILTAAAGMAKLAGQFTSMLLQDTTPWEGLNYSVVSVQVF